MVCAHSNELVELHEHRNGAINKRQREILSLPFVDLSLKVRRQQLFEHGFRRTPERSFMYL